MESLLASQKRQVAEGVLTLGHTVFVQLAMNAHCRDNGCRVPLKTWYLQKILGRHHLKEIRETAERIGYVGRDRSYRPGYWSQRYWIREPYDQGPLVKRQITDSGLCKRIRTWREQRRRESWERIRRNETRVAAEVCEHLWRHLQRLRIDENVEVGNACDHVQHKGAVIVVDRIRSGDSWFEVDAFGRIHTVVTSLPRTLRKHLSVDGKRLVDIDISESQPLFVGLALARHQTDGDGGGHAATLMLDNVMLDKTTPSEAGFNRDRLAPDLIEYLALCERRGLYQLVGNHLGISRDDAKQPTLQVFFDKSSHRNAGSEFFEQRFPTVTAAMRAVKQEDYCRLAHFAQRIESSFMYGRVVPRLMRERPELFITTIHDSVLTTTGEGDFVKQVMKDEFAQLNVYPNIKLKKA